ncbi:MAG: TetR/AcrR family transcriptional regulator [Micromonosporaceae bacterium]
MSEGTTRRYSGRTLDELKLARRERLLDAALELYGTDGYPATSVERLCTAAKVSTRHFYQEFPNKEAVLIAVHGRLVELALQSTAKALAEAPASPITARLEGAVTAYLETVMADQRRARLAFVEVVGASPEVERQRLAFRETIIALVEYEGGAAVARGEIEPRDFRFAGMAFIGAVNAVVYDWFLHEPRPPRAQFQASLVDLAVTLLTRDPGPAPGSVPRTEPGPGAG